MGRTLFFLGYKQESKRYLTVFHIFKCCKSLHASQAAHTELYEKPALCHREGTKWSRKPRPWPGALPDDDQPLQPLVALVARLPAKLPVEGSAQCTAVSSRPEPCSSCFTLM